MVLSHSMGIFTKKIYNCHGYLQKCAQVGLENIKFKCMIQLHVQVMIYNKCAKQILCYKSAGKIISLTGAVALKY